MELDTSTWMMGFFIVSFIISMFKIYPFLKTTTLKDDDTTVKSQKKLIKIVQKYKNKSLGSKELLELIKNDEDFDKELFWRFNENKLNQLLIKMNSNAI